MKPPSFPGLALALFLVGLSLVSCSRERAPILEHRSLLQSFDWWDNQDWDWYEERIPFFESPDPELDATYYYRWELITKHLVYGSPESGYTFTEFIDRPYWSGAYGSISCPLGHQAYEIRWLKDRRIIEDFGRYWFETPGAEPRSYSNWYGDAMWATYLVTGDSTLLRRVYPHMESQVAGWTAEHWDGEHGMYRWVGAWDGMETNINSRLTNDEFGGGEGYRPTLNSYLFADLQALAQTATLFGDDEKAAEYEARARALKARVQEELWDPEREFFFHQFAFDEKGGIRAKSLTYQTGPYAGSPHGRELLGYVPWQFNLPDEGYEVAWRFLMDPEYFWAPFGPTGVEQGDPQFLVSPQCCVWSGNSWPYATTQTLVAMANLLNNYEQEVVGKDDYFRLLRSYSASQRMNGRPYIGEAMDPFTGSWAGHNTFYHSEHYFHSGFVDLVISGLVGLRPRADDTLVVNPLVPEEWGYFALQGVDYHGHTVDILWDRDGSKYRSGAGLAVYVDGRELARARDLRELRVTIPAPLLPGVPSRMVDYAVNNDGGHFPFASASTSHPLFPPFYAVDGNRWYHPSPPNRWVAEVDPRGLSTLQPNVASPGEEIGPANPSAQEEPGPAPQWFQVDFGVDRSLTQVKLYFLDDEHGPSIEAVGEEEQAGYPVVTGVASDLAGPPALPPERYQLQQWTGESWRVVSGQVRDPEQPVGRRANTVTFPVIRTSRIRVLLHTREAATTGLTELEAWGPETQSIPEPTAAAGNLALNRTRHGAPRVSASFTHQGDSPWEAVDGRMALSRYARNRWTASGSPNPEDWVEVDFGRQEKVRRVDLFFFGDGRGVAAPDGYRVEVWTDSGWRPVEGEERDPFTPLAWAMNRVDFQAVESNRLRVVLHHAAPTFAGLVEIRVFR